MIAHVAIRRTRIGRQWVHTHGWVLGAQTGAGFANTRAAAIQRACIEALSAGALAVALPAARDWSEIEKMDADELPSLIVMRTHDDPAAVAVAARAASVEMMRECIRRRGVPDLDRDAAGAIEMLGGPETVADVLGCDAAQVCRWARVGLPAVRRDALMREVEALS